MGRVLKNGNVSNISQTDQLFLNDMATPNCGSEKASASLVFPPLLHTHFIVEGKTKPRRQKTITHERVGKVSPPGFHPLFFQNFLPFWVGIVRRRSNNDTVDRCINAQRQKRQMCDSLAEKEEEKLRDPASYVRKFWTIRIAINSTKFQKIFSLYCQVSDDRYVKVVCFLKFVRCCPDSGVWIELNFRSNQLLAHQTKLSISR